MRVARAQSIPQDRELIHAISPGILGRQEQGASRAGRHDRHAPETEMYLVTIGSSPARNLRTAVFERARLQGLGARAQRLASRASPCSQRRKGKWVFCLVEMGGSTKTSPLYTKARVATRHDRTRRREP